jgi:hypothetical protein
MSKQPTISDAEFQRRLAPAVAALAALEDSLADAVDKFESAMVSCDASMTPVRAELLRALGPSDTQRKKHTRAMMRQLLQF